MPLYEYQCNECGLRVEKLWSRISLAKDTIPCTSCSKEMVKLVSSVNFKFSHSASQLRGAAPPNTGTSDDWNYDRIIGRDSEKKWQTVEQRTSEKDRIIRQEKEKGLEVKRNQLVAMGEGYRVITEPERIKVNAGRELAANLNQELSKQIQKERKEGER